MSSLRERQTAVTRTTVLDAVLELLEEEPEGGFSLARVAERAGVGERTLYRHFATREELFAAAGELLVERLGMPIGIEGGPNAIPASFLDASARLMRHPRLARALVASEGGRAVRGGPRHRRSEAIAETLAPLLTSLGAAEAERATALVQQLCSASAWLRLHEETGISPDEARLAIAWALETLIADLRERRDHQP